MTNLPTEPPVSKWDAPINDLGAAAKRGVKQTAGFRLLSLIVQFGSAAVLARLLGPEAFGIIALATLVTAFAQIFNDMGIGSAIIQREKLDETTLATAFWLNFAIGFVLCACISALAPVFSAFFDSPELLYVLPIASLSLVLSVSLVQRSLLQRQMRFAAVMGLDFFYGVTSAALSVGLVLIGFGVASIPIGAAAATALSSLVAAVICRWRPRAKPTWASCRQLWGYSGHVLAFNVINYWTKNLDNVLVGKFLGNASLGFYSRAYNLMQLPVTNLNRVLSTVLFPALSALQSDPNRFRRGWLSSCTAGLLVGFWVAVVSAVTSPDLVYTLYGSEWLPMTDTLTVLMLATPAYILASNASPVFLALGATRLQFRLGLITTVLRVVAITIGLQFDYLGVAYGILISGYLNLLVTTWPAMRLAGIRVAELFKQLRWIVLATVLSGAVGCTLRFFIDLPEVVRLLVIGSAMTLSYAIAVAAFDRSVLALVAGKRMSVSR